MKTSRPEKEQIHVWKTSANSSDSTDLNTSCRSLPIITTKPESWCQRNSSQQEAILFIKLKPDGRIPAHICLFTQVWLENQSSRFSSSPLLCAAPVTVISTLTGLYSFILFPLSEACGGCWSQLWTVRSPPQTITIIQFIQLICWLLLPDPCNKPGFSSA